MRCTCTSALPDPDAAIGILNGLRPHLPLLQGLGANSPYWFGADSGLASARFSIVRAYPRRGVPRFFSGWDEYAEHRQGDRRGRRLRRLHVDLVGRARASAARDGRGARDRRAGVARRCRGAGGARARAAAQALESPPAEGLPAEAIGESSFRASRDGLDATILHDGALRPLREVARATVASVAGHARELGAADALEGIERILREGGGAARRRAAVQRGGMQEQLAELVRDTEGA